MGSAATILAFVAAFRVGPVRAIPRIVSSVLVLASACGGANTASTSIVEREPRPRDSGSSTGVCGDDSSTCVEGGKEPELVAAGCFAIPPSRDAPPGAGVRVASGDAGFCGDLPAARCSVSEPDGLSWASFLEEPAVVACGDTFDGCRCATFHFDEEGCLAAVDPHEANGLFPPDLLRCFQTALSARRWECAAGKAVTYFESCGVR